jgi:N-acetylglucosaminyldiphosphoundecaprenol N-acetyl-beta-D-mannosaminyltransferase
MREPPAGSPALDRAAVLGVDCFRGDLDAATTAVLERVHSGQGGYACLCNVHVLMTAQRDPALLAALRHSWVVFPDGAPVARLIPRSSDRPHPRRIGGPDLMPMVLDRSRAYGIRHGLYGSTPEVVHRLKRRIERQYPGIDVPVAIAPRFGEPDENEVAGHLAEIERGRVDILWVALGAPRQELWMARYSDRLPSTAIIGVGAAFDFLAGTKSRAPRWMQGSGLEWAHRFGSEPRRLGRRYLVTNARFIAAASHEVFHRHLRP